MAPRTTDPAAPATPKLQAQATQFVCETLAAAGLRRTNPWGGDGWMGPSDTPLKLMGNGKLMES